MSKEKQPFMSAHGYSKINKDGFIHKSWMENKVVAAIAAFFSKCNLGFSKQKNNPEDKSKSALFSSFKIATRINTLVVLAIIAMGTIAGISYYQTTKIQGFFETEKEVSSLGAQALKLEKDFLLFSLQTQEFFNKKDIEFAKEVETSLTKLIKSLNSMKRLPSADTIDAEINVLIKNGQAIEGIFSELVTRQELLGFSKYSGLHKNFHTAGEKLEVTIIKIGDLPKMQVELSKMRRFESAYLETGNRKNIGRVASGKSIIESLFFTSGLNKEQRQSLKEPLNKYAKEFLNYTKKAVILAKSRTKFNIEFENLSPNFEALGRAADSTLEQVELQAQQSNDRLADELFI